MRISISISEKDLTAINDYCDRNGYTRSGFLVSSAFRRMYDEESAKFPTPPVLEVTPAPKMIKTPKQAKAAIKEPQDNSYFNPVPKPVKKKKR